MATGGAASFSRLTDSAGGRVTQVFKWTAAARGEVTLTGVVRGSPEAFAAASEPREDGLPVVRHAMGPVSNRLNRAFYDRRFDWVLSVDEPARVELAPVARADSAVAYEVSASGGEVSLRFRPRFYQRHRGLAQFRPWEYRPWTKSVAGWTSWYAYFDKVTEQDIHRTAEVLAETLLPFGYTYLQIDDGYQRLPIGLPGNWLNANEKFPSGLADLRRVISARGLQPGIWTNVSFQDRTAAAAHPSWFVRTPDGQPALGNWVGYVMDGSSAGTMDTLVTPVYRALRRMGWDYFKLDALRHLRYEGYNSYAGYFAARKLDREAVFRGFVRQVREAIGRDVYLLACWGIRPELIGLVDGMRVGDDGFGYGSFAQYNSFNNVVWRNDPDHIELRQPDGYRAATLTSLTGSVLMLTDRPEVYQTDRVEAARRTAPVLFTRPGQLYDVDPSRSVAPGAGGHRAERVRPPPVRRRPAGGGAVLPARHRPAVRAVDGAGPHPGRRRRRPARRTRPPGRRRSISGSSSGPGARSAWCGGRSTPGRSTRGSACRWSASARALDRPQLVATSRHVTCGGPDLRELSWKDDALSGTSELVAGDPYEIYLNEPAGIPVRGGGRGGRARHRAGRGRRDARHPARKRTGRDGAVEGAVPPPAIARSLARAGEVR